MSKLKYDIEYLKKYQRGELSSREMFLLEKEAEQDELLMDLIKGMEGQDFAVHDTHISDIQIDLKDRINSHTQPTKKIINWPIVSIAASIVVLLGISFFLLKDNLTEKTIIAQAPVQNVEPKISVTPLDSMDSEVDFDSSESDHIAHNPSSSQSNATRSSTLTSDNAKAKIEAQEIIKKQLEASRNRLENMQKPSKLKYDSFDSRIAGIAPSARNIQHVLTLEKADEEVIDMLSLKKNTIIGTVLDRENGRAIAGAIIKNLDENTITTSDSVGRFVLQTEKKDPRLEALAVGYDKQNFVANLANSQIRLAPSSNEIDEVVVVGYGTQAKKAVVGSVTTIKNKKLTLSEPTAGWKAYSKYIKEATKQTKISKTEVYLQFEIDALGKPVNIRIYQSGGPIADQRAVDIVRNGPDWKKGTNNAPVELKIEF